MESGQARHSFFVLTNRIFILPYSDIRILLLQDIAVVLLIGMETSAVGYIYKLAHLFYFVNESSLAISLLPTPSCHPGPI